MKENLVEVLNNNKKWPIILKNVSETEIENSVIINSNISNSELAVLLTENGTETPKWLKDLLVKSKLEENVVLTIANIDKIDVSEQEKFYGLLKYKSLNGFDLPTNSQIVLTCSNIENVSEKIKSLCIIF